MSIARGFVTQPVDFQLPVLQLPFEQIYQQMNVMQQQKDQFDVLSEMMPNYLNVDSEQAAKYRGFVDSAVQSISDAFASGDTTQAMRMLNAAKRDLTKEWKPGGIASALQDRYDQYAKATQEIKEHTSDFTQPGYQEFFNNQLQRQLQSGMNYDPSSGTYNKIGTPNLFGEVNVANEVDTYLKGWAADKGYNIRKSGDGMWYYVETNEVVPERELRTALQSFYQRPDINRAMGVNAWYQTQMIPENMRDAYTQQYRQQTKDKLLQEIAGRSAAIDDMEELLQGGKNATTLQQQLRSLGYDVPQSGVMDDETIAAAQGYINSARENLQSAISNADQIVANASLTDMMMEQQRQALSSAYAPKYAFTRKDIKMVANTPAIAMMKMRAQKQMQDSLLAQFVRPTPTVVSPVKAEVEQVATIPTQYKEAQENYQKLEGGIVENLPDAFRSVLKGKQTYPFGQGSQAMLNHLQAKYQPTVKRSNAITQALRASTYDDQFDPIAYRTALDNQGIKLTDQEFQEHTSLFRNRDNRMSMEAVNDQLLPSYMAVEATGDMYRQFSTAVENSKDVDWQEIAERSGTFDITSEGFGGSGNVEYNADRAKQRFLEGDERLIQTVQKWAIEHNSSLVTNLEGLTNVDMIVNETLDPYREQYARIFSTNPLQAINRNKVDEETMNALGFDQNGKRLEDQPKINSVEFGVRNVNGKSVLVGMVTTDKSSSPIVLSTDQLNAPFLQEYIRTGAAATMNPNNPGEVMDPASFSMFSSMYYDLENDGGTGYNANTITRMREQKNYGRIGMETPTIMGKKAHLETLLLPNSDGTQEYLITISQPGIADGILSKGLRVGEDGQIIKPNGIVTDELRQLIDNNPYMEAVPLTAGFQGVKDAIMESKAQLVDPIMKNEIMSNPLKYQTSRTNITSEAPLLGPLLNSMFDF